MGKLLLGFALAALFVGCASDSGNKGAVGDSSGVSSGSETNEPNQRSTAPNINMKNWSTERRGR